MEEWKNGRMEECNCLNQDYQERQERQDKSLHRGLRGEHGRMEGWKDGRVEEWKDGRVEEWKDGRV